MQTSPLLNAAETADYLRVSRASVYVLLAQGALRGVKIGRSRRFSQAELDRYIEELERREREDAEPTYAAVHR